MEPSSALQIIGKMKDTLMGRAIGILIADGSEGAIETMEALSDSTVFLGYMILKQIRVCALGSFMFDLVSMAENMQTLGANPPRHLKPLFKTLDAMPILICTRRCSGRVVKKFIVLREDMPEFRHS